MKAGNKEYMNLHDLPDRVPVFPLKGCLLLPGGHMPLNIFEPRYLAMIDDAMASDKLIGMIQPCLTQDENGSATEKLSGVGCLGRITAFQETGDGRYLITLCGVSRFNQVEELSVNTDYRQCRIEAFEDDLENDDEGININREDLLRAFRNYLDANQMNADWDSINKTDSPTLVTALCMMCPYDPIEKQALLEAPDLQTRAETLVALSEIHLARQGYDDNQIQ
ncbi:MAG: LON peptidase substrate-binding domain-containing protein [Pseudomonadota bacterium]